MTSVQLLTTRQKSIAFVLIMLIWRQTQMFTLAVLCFTSQNLLLENNLSVFFLWLITWSVVPLVSYFKLCVGFLLLLFLIRGAGREQFCLMSTEARWSVSITCGKGTREWRLNGRHQPGRPWCHGPLAEQQVVDYAIAVPTAVRNSHKDNVRSSAVGKRGVYI